MSEQVFYPTTVNCDGCGDEIAVRSETDSDIYANDADEVCCRRCYIDTYLDEIMECCSKLGYIDCDTTAIQSAIGNVRDTEDIQS